MRVEFDDSCWRLHMQVEVFRAVGMRPGGMLPPGGRTFPSYVPSYSASYRHPITDNQGRGPAEPRHWKLDGPSNFDQSLVWIRQRLLDLGILCRVIAASPAYLYLSSSVPCLVLSLPTSYSRASRRHQAISRRDQRSRWDKASRAPVGIVPRHSFWPSTVLLWWRVDRIQGR
jgi:hypothetical protein